MFRRDLWQIQKKAGESHGSSLFACFLWWFLLLGFCGAESGEEGKFERNERIVTWMERENDFEGGEFFFSFFFSLFSLFSRDR